MNIELYDKIKKLYLKYHKEKTWNHVNNVAKEAKKLAIQYHLDIEKCMIAALLHDISAILSPDDMYKYAKELGYQIDPSEEKYHFLLHQRISKEIAYDYFHIEDEDMAVKIIEQLRKKYWDARHNCYAYVLGGKSEIQRFSDDGEPSGTAGKPILEVITGNECGNCLCVVTRYFGGVLLGTGGLVRAYSKSVQAGLAASTVLEKKKGFLLAMETDYSGIGKIQYLLGQRGLLITDSQYTDKVTVETLVPQEELVSVKEEITEGTNGKTVFAKEEPVAYAFDGKTPVFF